MGISTQLEIEGKGDARAYKSNEDRQFGYANNNINFGKVKN